MKFLFDNSQLQYLARNSLDIFSNFVNKFKNANVCELVKYFIHFCQQNITVQFMFCVYRKWKLSITFRSCYAEQLSRLKYRLSK